MTYNQLNGDTKIAGYIFQILLPRIKTAEGIA
jgi:hypothetical protein